MKTYEEIVFEYNVVSRAIRRAQHLRKDSNTPDRWSEVIQRLNRRATALAKKLYF
jgi:hypothetical protein